MMTNSIRPFSVHETRGQYYRQNLHRNSVQKTTSRWWGAKKFLDSLLRPSLRPDEAHDASDVSPGALAPFAAPGAIGAVLVGSPLDRTRGSGYSAACGGPFTGTLCDCPQQGCARDAWQMASPRIPPEP